MWKLAAPQNKVLDDKQTEYIATRIISNNIKKTIADFDRFKVKGEGLKVNMNI
ncbi:MAG: hypothetical protein ABFS18_01525 [Thermodesulfobacteriota bacterium]